MRRLLKDTFRRITEDDDRRQAPAQTNQVGHPHQSYSYPGPGVWPLQPGMPGYAPVPVPMAQGPGPGVPQSNTFHAQFQPGPVVYGYSQHNETAQVASHSPWALQPAMPAPAPPPATISPPVVLPNLATMSLGDKPEPSSTSKQAHCRWCEKCKRGLAYNTLSYICTECTLWLCPSCHQTHQHQSKKSVIASLYQWGATPPEPPFKFSSTEEAPGLCVVCAPVKEIKARIQCKFCPYALCFSCAGKPAALASFLVGHNLKHLTLGLAKTTTDMDKMELMAVYPAGWFVTGTHRVRPCPCQERPQTGIMHCQRCHLLIEIGQHVYWCHGCFSSWGINQWICETCFQEDELHQDEDQDQEKTQAAHKQLSVQHKHDFVKTLVENTPNDPDTRKEALYCRVCKIWLATETDRNTHFHAHTNRDTDIVRRRAYLEWRISPWWLEMCRLSLHKKIERSCK